MNEEINNYEHINTVENDNYIICEDLEKIKKTINDLVINKAFDQNDKIVKNFISLLNDKLYMFCNHNFITDLVDITPNKSVYITTGPILEPGLPSIGPNRIPIPKAFYKVILDYTQPEVKAIGFVIPNQGSSLPLTSFALSIDSIEKITNLDFFEKLPDVIENHIEQSLCIGCWGL